MEQDVGSLLAGIGIHRAWELSGFRRGNGLVPMDFIA